VLKTGRATRHPYASAATVYQKRYALVMGPELVREARKRAGLTQAELARRVGSTQPAIARIEAGRSQPSFDRVVELIRACDLDLLVGLGPVDDADVHQARDLQYLDASQRLDVLVTTVHRLTELRELVDAQRAAR
jgi:transcriptional regulator with XRE-family HTH domain